MKSLKNQIEEKGFIFHKFKPDQDIYKELINTDTPNEKIEKFFRKVIIDFGILVDELELVYEDITVGKYHELHTHLTPCDFMVLVWVPKDSYVGRAFVYGTVSDLKKFYPTFGDVCFMKANDINFVHGVEPLENDTLVRTLIISVNHKGGKGQHVTVTADGLKSV